MQKLVRNFAAVATLSLTIMPVVTFAGAAFAQERVQVADLQLATADGAKAFTARVNTAATRFCVRDGVATDLARTEACKRAVWSEVVAKLSPAQQSAVKAS